MFVICFIIFHVYSDFLHLFFVLCQIFLLKIAEIVILIEINWFVGEESHRNSHIVFALLKIYVERFFQLILLSGL